MTILASGADSRLYDLDRIISRTLAYGLLTVLLGGGYAGVVLGFGQLLGQSSSLVVAGATLAVAAAFQPAAAASRPRSTAASTGAATTRPRRSRGSAPGCASTSTWTPYRPSCSAWSTRRCSRPRCRCGFVPPQRRRAVSSLASGTARQRASETRHQIEPGKPRRVSRNRPTGRYTA